MFKKFKGKVFLDLTRYYPLFFTVAFIFLLIQYSFPSFEAIFYDLRVKLDLGINFEDDVVLVIMDDESDQFLGENYPYTFATHKRFIKKLVQDNPSIINFYVDLEEPYSDNEKKNLLSFKSMVKKYQDKGGAFRFGNDMDAWGEHYPPNDLRELGHSLGLLIVENTLFAKDEVTRRAILSSRGDPTIHLWTANKFRKKNGEKSLGAKDFFGSYYLESAEATYALFRYYTSPLIGKSRIMKIPYHRVVVGNFPKGFFKDKIVLIGPRYLSNSNHFLLTPFNKEDYQTAKLNIHAQIIQALINEKTVLQLPRYVTDIFALLIGIFLSLIISKVQPAKGLLITIMTMLSIVLFSFLLFSFFGIWIYVSHLVLTIFIVYYIWVPFRAIAEYQTRYKIQEEAKLLKKVDNLKQNFISLMSHDLKTPVAKIAGISDILKTQYQNSKQQFKLLDDITKSTLELNNFITSILDLTKIESRNIKLNIETKDINKIIENVVNELMYEAKQNQVELVEELMPLYPISIDVLLIKRVISNIIGNAIKYSGPGSIVNVKTWDDEHYVYLKISDNGVGIPPKDLENIFEKFYRVKNDASHSIKGSGLGLYLVKYFVELHGGSISAESILQEGTQFLVKLKNK